jgi:t-SNARE complex subunit (syntaxin)
MTDLPEAHGTRRNRIGCFVILIILAVFVALYFLAGINAEPGNNSSEDIQTLPANR